MSRKLLKLSVVSAVAIVGLRVNSRPKKNAADIHFGSTLCESVPRNAYRYPTYSWLLNNFISGKLEGEILTMPDGSKYQGQLSGGQRSNHGESWDTKGHYVGSWAHNVKHGYGVLKYHNGFVYEGEFSNDLPNGQGKLTLRNGEMLEGVFVNGELQGHEKIPEFGWSKVSLDDGRFVEGDFTFLSDQSVFSGFGRVTVPGEYVYEGKIVDNQAEGKGKITKVLYNTVTQQEEKQIIHGTFSKGELMVPNSIAIIVSKHETFEVYYHHPNGKQYMRHTMPNGLIVEGEFGEGNFIGIVTIKDPDGTVSKGMLYNNKLYGKCSIKDPDGNVKVVNNNLGIRKRMMKWWEERK